MVEITYVDGTIEVVAKLLLDSILKTGNVKTYKHVKDKNSEYIRRGLVK